MAESSQLVGGDLLGAYAAATPDKAAVVDDRPGADVVTWSFAELDRRAKGLARVFADLGAGPGTKVVTVGPNSAGLVLGGHAVRRAGSVCVPLNYRLVADEAVYILDNCDATVVFADVDSLDLVHAAVASVPSVSAVVAFDSCGELTDPVLQADLDGGGVLPPLQVELPAGVEPAGTTMIYTSGTTGRPKGAVRPPPDGVQLGGLVALIGYLPEDVHLTIGPLYHSGPGGFAGLAQAMGSTVVVQHRFDPEDWLRLLDTYRATTTFTAPTPIRNICRLPAEVKARYDRSSMRRLVANAAPWTQALKRQYVADFPPDSLWEVYGSTELGVDCVLGPDDHFTRAGSCGRSAPGVEIILLDEHRAEITEPWTNGELFVRAKGMFSTYYKAEEKFEADRVGEFHTVGDIAHRDEDGFYYIADRKKDMIITGGVNVYPAEVEAALDDSPDVEEVAVFGVPSEEWGEEVHAAVVPSRRDVTAADIVEFARLHLAGYKIPRSVSFLPELPKTGSGKVLKRQLRSGWRPPAE